MGDFVSVDDLLEDLAALRAAGKLQGLVALFEVKRDGIQNRVEEHIVGRFDLASLLMAEAILREDVRSKLLSGISGDLVKGAEPLEQAGD